MQQTPYSGWQGQPAYQQPPSPPTKRRPPILWIVAVLFAFVAGIGIGVGSSHSGGTTADQPTATAAANSTQPARATQQPHVTPTPARTPTWTTTQQFSGNGTKKTGIFAVSGDWKIAYTCKAGDFDALLQVSVYDSNGGIVDFAAVNVTCKAGQQVSDSTEEHQAGNVYLDINGTTDWTLSVQELK